MTTKTRFVRIRTKNHSASPLRKAIATTHKVVVRLGSLTPTGEIFKRNPNNVIEINSPDAIECSRNKLRMKECFSGLDIPQADLFDFSRDFEYPVVIKRINGFKGRGMVLCRTAQEWDQWKREHTNTSGWMVERFYNYAKEYRIHVAKEIGPFMSWRKLRKEEATERWFFNSANSNWVGPDHELFDRPSCWAAMEDAAMNALTATGLDIGAVDIRVQSSAVRSPRFIVCEINSAPALGERGIDVYKDIITRLIQVKNNEQTISNNR